MRFIITFFKNLDLLSSYVYVLASAVLGSIISLFLVTDRMSLLYRFEIQPLKIFAAIFINIIFIVIGVTIMQVTQNRK